MTKKHGHHGHGQDHAAPAEVQHADQAATDTTAETGTPEQPTADHDAPPAPTAEPDPESVKTDGTETAGAYQERLKAQAEALDKLRAETPVQTVKIRPAPSQGLLGLVVRDSVDGRYLRTARMADWRTEEISLRAGESAHILVLAGEDADLFTRIEEGLKPKPAQDVAEVVESPAGGAPTSQPEG